MTLFSGILREWEKFVVAKAGFTIKMEFILFNILKEIQREKYAEWNE